METATNNKNRTAADVRSIFTKAGGSLAGAGAVAWQFEQRGVIAVPRDGQDPDEIALAAIDAGAEDVDTESDPVEIVTDSGAAGERAQVARRRRRQDRIGRDDDAAEVDRRGRGEPGAPEPAPDRELLEDHDDVQRVTANVEVPDEVLAEAASA